MRERIPVHSGVVAYLSNILLRHEISKDEYPE